jgi:hypothetical protein
MEFFRSVYQMQRKPYVFGGLLVLGSYTWNLVRGVERIVPEELVVLRQRDQMKRLKAFVQRRFTPWHSTPV